MATLDSGDAAQGAVPDRGAPHHVPVWPGLGSRGERWLGDARRGWPISVRVRVRLRRFSLDRRLARGADPCSSPQLARRAEELCRPKLRRELSADIERAVEDATMPARWLTAAAPMSVRSISQCRALLLGLAQDLQGTGPVYARGVALARLLLMDGGSSLYARSEPGELEEEVRRARDALVRG